MQKLSLSGNFTCPNRDGTLGRGGCTFCNISSFSGRDNQSLSISEQLCNANKKRSSIFLAYFQAYTSTYAEFQLLKKLYDVEYNGKADYKKHPKIWIITPDDAYEYTIFAFREISVKNDKDVYTVDQSVSKERRKFLDGQIRKSQKKTRMSPSENRRMITLSTCTSHTEDGRFVVQAGNID